MHAKRITAAATALSLALLSGCRSTESIYSNFREISRIEIITTVGIDRAGEGADVTISSGRSPEGGRRLLMSRRGESVEQAMLSLQDYASSEELFFEHLEYFLVGEDTAQDGLGPVLDHIARSPGVRLGVKLFAVRGGTAKDLMTGAGDDSYDVSEVLRSLERDVGLSGASAVFTAGETARALSENGAALICAVSQQPVEGVVYNAENAVTAIPAGFGIISGGELAGWLSTREANAVCLLSGRGGSPQLTVTDSRSGIATLIINDAECAVTPVYSGAALGSVTVTARLGASLLELSRPEHFKDSAYLDELGKLLQEAMSDAFASLFGKMSETRCDFLGLAPIIRAQGARKFDLLSPSWEELVQSGEVPVSVHVTAEVSRTLGLNAPAGAKGGAK